MKVQIIFTAIAVLSGALASHIVEVPEARSMSTMVIANLSVTTAASCVTDQSFSLTAVSNTYFGIWLSLFNLQVSTQYYFFYNNYAFVGLQVVKLVTFLSWKGQDGQNSISNILTSIIDTLTTGNSYYAVMDPVTAAAITTNINELITFQAQIETEMTKCVKPSKAISESCQNKLVNHISQFVYQASGIMRSITTGWCRVCTTDTTKCALATNTTTTTTESTSTTSPTTTISSTTTTISSSSTTTQSPGLLNFTECLATINSVVFESAVALNAQFWQLNISKFSIVISVPYYFFFQYFDEASAAGKMIADGMQFTGDSGCRTINASMTNLIDILEQGNSYIKLIDPTLYAEISTEIELMNQMKDECMAYFYGCQNGLESLVTSCGYDYYWKFSQFIYKFAFCFNEIIVSWCDICSHNLSFCGENTVPTSTSTTDSSTSTSTTDSTTSTTSTTVSSTSTTDSTTSTASQP